MLDCYNRTITTLRVSLTQNCNLNCSYCRPKGIQYEQSPSLSPKDFLEIIQAATQLGINRIKLTGGEPLLYPEIVPLVKAIANIESIGDLSLTTNGTLLPHYAPLLKKAGLMRVNIGLDTINSKTFELITGHSKLSQVLKGIKAAQEAGLTPIKINCVIQNSSKEKNAQELSEFADKHGLMIRYIRQMDLQTGQFWGVEGGSSGQCAECNRIRLTSDGKVWPCLFHEKNFDVFQYGAYLALQMAIEAKPQQGMINRLKPFYSLGG